MSRSIHLRIYVISAFAAAALTACADDPAGPPTPTAAPGPNAAEAGLPGYAVTDLGTLGGSFSVAFGVNGAGHVAGGANTAAEVSHFFLWRDGAMIDAGSLGGNGNAAINANDELAGPSETTTPDLDGEDFCGFGTHLGCLAAVWQNGVMTALPTLGGPNAFAANLNDRGQVAGTAETSIRDPSCAAGTPYQVHRYEGTLWGPGLGQIQRLPPLNGDEVSLAIGLNEHDQVVGSSGSCAATVLVGRITGPHAVMWDHGTPVALDPPGSQDAISVAASINDRGQVAGGFGTTTLHSFLWTRETGRQDIGTVDGDLGSFATGINGRGQVVGISCVNDALCDITNPELMSRAYLWQNGVMSDVNALVFAGPPLVLLTAFGINDRGQIVGLAFNLEDFQPHAYLATPVRGATPLASVVRSRTPTAFATLAQRPYTSRSGQSYHRLRILR